MGAGRRSCDGVRERRATGRRAIDQNTARRCPPDDGALYRWSRGRRADPARRGRRADRQHPAAGPRGQRLRRRMGPLGRRRRAPRWPSSRPDLVLLDLGLPDLDGLDVCRRMHDAGTRVAIVMLTARDEELDVVVGLDAGAIDYVTKPFRLAELLARIRAQLRRVDTSDAWPSPSAISSSTPAARRAWLDGDELVLRPRSSTSSPASMVDAGLRRSPRDPDGRGVGRALVRIDEDARLPCRRAAPQDRPRGRGPSRITTLRGVGYRSRC